MKKVSWGVLSTAKIGREKVIPAMQQGQYSKMDAIASRSLAKAQETAQKLKIPKAYGSYEALLEDPDIEAIYNPLPNHLHVEWAIRSLEAGKHVLCEKPIGLNRYEAEHLKNEMAKHPDLKVMEAFMYRFHPQWQYVKKMIDRLTIGEIRNIHSVFSYHNVDPNDVRNQFEIGGGGLLDIGCYCISLSRFLFGSEPVCVCGTVERDPEMEIDRLASGVLEFETGTATFTCSTQLIPCQHVLILGTHGRIEMEIPFTPSPEIDTKIKYQVESDTKTVHFDPCNQYTIQGDLFSEAVLNDLDVPTPIEDAVANMKVIDKIKESDQKRVWIQI